MSIHCPDPPAGSLPDVRLVSVSTGRHFFRVFADAYAVEAWDPRATVSYRFSPLKRGSGLTIPVSYAGSTPDIAILETVMRFAPDGGNGFIAKSHYAGKHIAEVVTTRPLRLVPLHGVASRKFREGVAVAIANAPASDYAKTRQWAQRFFDKYPLADGIEWVSHQQGTDTSIMLWQRDESESDAPFRKVDASVPMSSPAVLAQMQRLALDSGHTLEV